MPRFLFLILALLAHPASACSVPVFRYALEHWAADSYEAIVFHRGALAGQDQALVNKLGEQQANVSIKSINLDQLPSDELIGLWRQVGSPASPWLVLRQPVSARPRGVVWSGALSEAGSHPFFDSPARQEIAERLGSGESAVWVLIESGDKAKDDAAAKMLESRLEYLAGVMALPKLDEQDIRNGLVSVPDDGLRLAFSTLRVSRDNAAESVFIQMLLATEPDLKDLREPMAFPVFGQGRVLYALVGNGIKHETIETAASFLIGSCSCQVKEQNPGVDLLMAVDWRKLIKSQNEVAPDLPKLSEIASALPQTVTISASPAAPSPEKRHPLWLLAILYLVSPLITAVALVMVWNKRKRRSL